MNQRKKEAILGLCIIVSIPLLWGLLLNVAYVAVDDVNRRIDQVRFQLESKGIPVHAVRAVNSTYDYPTKSYLVDNGTTFVSAVHKLGDPIIWVSYASVPISGEATLRWQNITCSPTYIEKAIGQCGKKEIDELRLSIPVQYGWLIAIGGIILMIWTVGGGLLGLVCLFPGSEEKAGFVGNMPSEERRHE